MIIAEPTRSLSTSLLTIVIESNSLMSWSFIDVVTGRCSVGDGKDLDEVRRVIIGATYSECLLISGDMGRNIDIKVALGLRPETCVERQLSKNSPAYENAVLAKAYPDTGFLTPAEFVDLERRPCALAALVAGIEFAHEHCEASISRLQKPHFVQGIIMETSSDALRQLDVIDVLLPLLNTCRTAVGRRAFRERLLAPRADREWIVAKHDEIAHIIKHNLAEDVRKLLDYVIDLERIYKRAVLGRASAEDLISASSSLRSAAKVMDMENPLNSTSTRALQLAEQMSWPFSREASLLNPGSVFLRGAFSDVDDASDMLATSKAEFDAARDSLNLAMGSDHVRLEVEGESINLSVTTKRWTTFASKSPDLAKSYDLLQPLRSSSNPRLVNASLLESSATYARAHAELNQRVRDRFSSMVLVLLENHDVLFEAVGEIERIDMAAALAVNAQDLGHVRPTLYAVSSKLEFTELRHPIIEGMRDRQEPYVPNSIR